MPYELGIHTPKSRSILDQSPIPSFAFIRYTLTISRDGAEAAPYRPNEEYLEDFHMSSIVYLVGAVVVVVVAPKLIGLY